MLDSRRFESGNAVLNQIAFSPLDLLDGVRQQFEVESEKKGVQLEVVADQALPGYLIGDRDRLRQVLSNPVGHTLKFTDLGSVRVYCWSSVSEPGRILLKFEVHDTGVGIPSDFRRVMFESFAQLDSPLTRRHGGSGSGSPSRNRW